VTHPKISFIFCCETASKRIRIFIAIADEFYECFSGCGCVCDEIFAHTDRFFFSANIEPDLGRIKISCDVLRIFNLLKIISVFCFAFLMSEAKKIKISFEVFSFKFYEFFLNFEKIKI
jgi:hypothetical protein